MAEKVKTKRKAIVMFIIGVLVGLAIVGGYYLINELTKPKTPWVHPFLSVEKRVFDTSITEEQHIENLTEIIETGCWHILYDTPKYTIYPVSSFDGHPEYYYIVTEGAPSQLVTFNQGTYYTVADYKEDSEKFWEKSGVLGNSEYELYCGFVGGAQGSSCIAYKHKAEGTWSYIYIENGCPTERINHNNYALEEYFINFRVDNVETYNEVDKNCRIFQVGYDHLAHYYDGVLPDWY